MILQAFKNRWKVILSSLIILFGFNLVVHSDSSLGRFLLGFLAESVSIFIIYSIVIFFDIEKSRRRRIQELTTNEALFPYVPSRIEITPYNERVVTTTTYAYSLYEDPSERKIVEEQQEDVEEEMDLPEVRKLRV